jgi:hypothetical protein
MKNENYLLNLHKIIPLWYEDVQLNMSYEQKSELQQFVFPKGTTFEKEKQRVRTPEVNLLFELTKRTTGIYENKKSGILTHNEMDSALVDLSVLELKFIK